MEILKKCPPYQDKSIIEKIINTTEYNVLTFDEIFLDDTRKAKKIKKCDYLEIGEYPIIDQGQQDIGGYTNDKEKIYNNVPFIIFGDHTRIIKYLEVPSFIGADGVKVINIKDDKKCAVNVRYIYYYLLYSNIPSDGYSRHFKYIKNLLYILPPINIQKQIVEILDEAQILIDNRKEQIKLLDDLIESVFYDMFGDPILNNKGWKVEKLGRNINVLTDYHANGSYKILRENVELLNNQSYALMIRTTDLEKKIFINDVKYIDKHAYEFLEKSKVYGGDIIINKIGSAGQVYLMPELNRKVSLGMNQFLLRTNENIKHIYLYTLFNTERGEYMIKSKAKGAVTKTINKKAINDLKIPLPPIQLQNQFAEKVELIESQKQLLEDSLKLLEDNYDSLMQRAFKGELFN